MQLLIMWGICMQILSCFQITSSSQIMFSLEQLTAKSMIFLQKVIESQLLKKFCPFDSVLNHISPVNMLMSSLYLHVWSATYIVHDNSTCNASSSAAQPSQFNTKISQITAKLHAIVCHQHLFHSQQLCFYLIWIQKGFIFDFCFRQRQFMKIFQVMEMEILQG